MVKKARYAVRSTETVSRGKRKGTVRYGHGRRINSDSLLYKISRLSSVDILNSRICYCLLQLLRMVLNATRHTSTSRNDISGYKLYCLRPFIRPGNAQDSSNRDWFPNRENTVGKMRKKKQ